MSDERPRGGRPVLFIFVILFALVMGTIYYGMHVTDEARARALAPPPAAK